jgi:hypothetical protein
MPSLLAVALLSLSACESYDDDVMTASVGAMISGYPATANIPLTEFTVINQWEAVNAGVLEDQNRRVYRNGSTNDDDQYAIADASFEVPADQDFELRAQFEAIGTQPTTYNTDLRLGLDDASEVQSSQRVDAFIRVLRDLERSGSSNTNVDGQMVNNSGVEGVPLVVGDMVFVSRRYSATPTQTLWEFGVVKADGTRYVHGSGTGFNFSGAARPKVSIGRNGMKLRLLLLKDDAYGGSGGNGGNGGSGGGSSSGGSSGNDPVPALVVIDQWDAVNAAVLEDQNRRIYRNGTSNDDDQYAIADAAYEVPADQDFELQALIQVTGTQPSAYSTDLRLGLDDASAVQPSQRVDAFIRVLRDLERSGSSNTNVSGQMVNNAGIEGMPLVAGDVVFVSRRYSATPTQTLWEFGAIKADGTRHVHGSGTGFNFSGAARPKVSLGRNGMKVQLQLFRDGTGSGSGTGSGTGSGSGGALSLVHPVGPQSYNAWEIFDPSERNYDGNPQATYVNDYFRRRVVGRDATYAGVNWSTEVAPLIPGDGQVMKSWVRLQNPNNFVINSNFRADLETRGSLDDFGWTVYDPNLPQKRAYSVAFKMPTDFTYSTTSSGIPGTIEEEGYNWIIAQWLDYSSPVTPPYAIHMRGKDLLFREKIYGNWHPIVSDVDQHFQRGEWIVFLAIVDWTFGANGSFVLFYDWVDPANPQPTNWTEAVRLTGRATMHPQVRRRATPMFKVGGYYWLLKNARNNQIWWDDNVGVNRTFVMYYDQWRAITLTDPRFSNFNEANIKQYFGWQVN